MAQDKAKKREKLGRIAMRVFKEHGIKASMQQVASQANIAVGTLYYYFDSKEDLLETLFEIVPREQYDW